jgi:adenylate cyclase
MQGENEMARIHFLPDDKEVESDASESVLAAALRANVPIMHACGGRARCSTCRILVLEGIDHCSVRTEAETEIAEKMRFDMMVRLACQTHGSGPLKVRRIVIDDDDVQLTSLFVKEGSPSLAGVEMPVLILFADIRGFTQFAEALLPYDVIHVLNRYFFQMGHVIERHGGRIENYMGDGFLALFEARNAKEGALRAIRAGLGMLAAVEKMQPYLEKLFHRSFQIGIGLHYGRVVAGTLGAKFHRREMIIGDAVNFASRIERANKEMGTRFLISEDVHSLVEEAVSINKKVRIPIRGKSGEHFLYEIVGMV